MANKLEKAKELLESKLTDLVVELHGQLLDMYEQEFTYNDIEAIKREDKYIHLIFKHEKGSKITVTYKQHGRYERSDNPDRYVLVMNESATGSYSNANRDVCEYLYNVGMISNALEGLCTIIDERIDEIEIVDSYIDLLERGQVE